MLRPLLLAGVALACLGGAPVRAAPDAAIDLGGTPPSCARADDLVACLSGLADRSAARVRAALARTRAALTASRTLDETDRAAALATLERTQRAWRAYVKLRCEGEIPVAFTGGTGRNPAILTCLRIHDERRAAELTDLARMD